MADNEKINEVVEEIKENVTESFEKASEKIHEKVEEIKKETDDYTAEQDPADVDNNKVMAILAYIGILVLIPLICAKNSKFARFHTNQGLVLFLIGIICGLCASIPVVGILFKIAAALVFVCQIVGIVYAAQGKAKEIPVIGNIVILK